MKSQSRWVVAAILFIIAAFATTYFVRPGRLRRMELEAGRAFVAYSDNGQWALTSKIENNSKVTPLRLFDLARGVELGDLKTDGENNEAYHQQLSPDGNLLALRLGSLLSDFDKPQTTLFVFDIKRMKRIAKLETLGRALWMGDKRVRFSDHNKAFLYPGVTDPQEPHPPVMIWRQGDPEDEGTPLANAAFPAALSPDGKHVAAVELATDGTAARHIMVVDIRDQGKVVDRFELNSKFPQPTAICWSRDGQRIAVAEYSKTAHHNISVWSPGSKPRVVLEDWIELGTVFELAFVNEQYLMMRTAYGRHLVNMTANPAVVEAKGPSTLRIPSLTSPDGKYAIILPAEDGPIRLWKMGTDVASALDLGATDKGNQMFTRVTFSDDSSQVAVHISFGDNRRHKVWTTANGRLIADVPSEGIGFASGGGKEVYEFNQIRRLDDGSLYSRSLDAWGIPSRASLLVLVGCWAVELVLIFGAVLFLSRKANR